MQCINTKQENLNEHVDIVIV